MVLKLHPDLVPYKVAVLPLLKKRPEIVELCHRIKADLQRDVMTVYDDTAAIGKLYRRQDEIGTPWCVTVDVDSLDDGAVTVRDRDSMSQERVPLENVRRPSSTAWRPPGRPDLRNAGRKRRQPWAPGFASAPELAAASPLPSLALAAAPGRSSTTESR